MTEAFKINTLLEQEVIIDEWEDCFLSEVEKTGYICVFELDNKKQTFYGLNDKEKLLTLAKKGKLDTYISLNAFNYGERSSSSLKQIRNIGVDLDFYKLNITLEEALKMLKAFVVKGIIPNPNLLIFTGRGLQLVYSIGGGASPKMSFITQYITVQFISALKLLNADTQATDTARIFRLVGSKNSKNNVTVKAEVWRKLKYSLEELYSFVLPLEIKRKRGKPKKNNVTTIRYANGTMTLYSLNQKRMTDLLRLAEIRKYDFTDCRNQFFYIYAFTTALFTKSLESTRYFTDNIRKLIFSRNEKPLTKKVIDRTIKSGFDDAVEFYEKFIENGSRMRGLPNNLIKPMKNETIVDKLHITADEMRQMSTIIDKTEKQRRDTEKKRIQRGSVTREEYLAAEKNHTDKQLAYIRKVLSEKTKPKWKDIAKELGISDRQLRNIRKKL